MTASHFLSQPVLSRVPFKERAANALAEILGSKYMRYPNFTVRRAKYVPWHIDRGFVGSGSRSHGHDVLCVQSAVHLQDNSDEYGGGLDVLKGSHRILRDCPLTSRLGQDLWSYALAVSGRYPRVRVDSACGDLVLWDGRLFHRGTPARRPARTPKLALYWSASSNNEVHASRYLSHLKRKGYKWSLRGWELVERYDEIDAIHFPESFPPEVVESLTRSGIAMATFNTVRPASTHG